MIGPGTGVAPFIGFMEEREVMMGEGKKMGEAYLFFGCRNRKSDYIYEKEIEKFRKKGAVSEVIEAFSREQEKKVYV
jgi:NADPH-ferrihemoprotein reductase